MTSVLVSISWICWSFFGRRLCFDRQVDAGGAIDLLIERTDGRDGEMGRMAQNFRRSVVHYGVR
jgi:hypothetical protein